MNIYYIFGFLVGIAIGLYLAWNYLPYVDYIKKSQKETKEKELEKENSNSVFDLD